MARLTDQQLENIKKEHNVDRIWSWSRVNTFITSPYEYYLKYILQESEDRTDCCYGVLGNICHDTLDNYYEGKISYDQMINTFEDGWISSIDVLDLKFDRNDEAKNESISKKYKIDLQYFFKNHIPYKEKLLIEKPIKIDVNGEIFVGYIDAIYKDIDGVYHIIDFKTSTQYTGKNLIDHSGQLILYALGLHQTGIPLNRIKIKFNFLKYVTVQQQQKKKGSPPKYRDIERCLLGEKLKSNVSMWLKDGKYSEQEIDSYIYDLLLSNDISVLPLEIQNKYVITDCHTEIPLTDELILSVITRLSSTIKDIRLRERDYQESQSEMAFFDTDESVEKESYYFATLCGYSPNKHKPYKKYLERLETQKNGENMFNGVGTDIQSEDDLGDLAWLNDI